MQDLNLSQYKRLTLIFAAQDQTMTPRTVDFDGLDNLIDGKSESRSDMAPISTVESSPSFESSFSPPQPLSQTEEAENEVFFVPGKRFTEIRKEIFQAKIEFEQQMKTRTNAVRSSVEMLNTELAKSPERKDRALRLSLTEGIVEMEERLKADVEEEARSVETSIKLKIRMAEMKEKISKTVSQMQAEVSEHKTQCDSLLEAKSQLASDISELQATLNTCQLQLNDDESRIYGAIGATDEPLLALQDTHSVGFRMEMNGIELQGMAGEVHKLESTRTNLLGDIQEMSSSVEDKRGGISELTQMQHLMIEKYGTLTGEDVDHSEKAAFEGEIKGVAEKILNAEAYCKEMETRMGEIKGKVASIEARMESLREKSVAKETEMKESTNAAEDFEARARALMAIVHDGEESDMEEGSVVGGAVKEKPVMKQLSAPVVEPLVVRQKRVSSAEESEGEALESWRCKLETTTSLLEELREWKSQLEAKLERIDASEKGDASDRATLADELEAVTLKLQTKEAEMITLEKSISEIKKEEEGTTMVTPAVTLAYPGMPGLPPMSFPVFSASAVATVFHSEAA